MQGVIMHPLMGLCKLADPLCLLLVKEIWTLSFTVKELNVFSITPLHTGAEKLKIFRFVGILSFSILTHF